MIKIKGLKKTFGKQSVLKGINLAIEDNGLYFLTGPSGCGKTTLFSCLSGLTSYEGSIYVNGHFLEKMSQEKRSYYRLSCLGFVFQDFKLIETETVFNNISFPLEVLCKTKKNMLKRRVEELMDIFEISSLSNHMVSTLSGGEKQRVALARSLVTDPDILLCDEPTGSLDEKNTLLVFKLLKKISRSKPVLVITHDIDSALKFGKVIFVMEDGLIKKKINRNNQEEECQIKVRKNTFYVKKKPSIPSHFLYNHSLANMKHKKVRTSITLGITSLGLIGVGLATTISSLVGNNIKASYSSLLGENRIVVKEKQQKNLTSISSCSYIEAANIVNQYPNEISDVGVCYSCDFESFFQDENTLSVASSIYREVIPSYSIRHVNEFSWLDLYKGHVYPYTPKTLEEDEIVLALDESDISVICYSLRIIRSLESLSDYVEANELFVCFNLENKNWQYSDEQLFKVVGFTIDRVHTIYHYDHLWNEKILEGRMRFPSSVDISKDEYYPWILKKYYYLQTKSDPFNFLQKARYEPNMSSFLFDLGDKKYFPWKYELVPFEDISQLIIIKRDEVGIDLTMIKYMRNLDSYLDDVIIGTQGGYAIYDEALMMGFSDSMYFSFSLDALDEAIDISTSMSLDQNETSILPDGVLAGHYSSSMNEGVCFSSKGDLLYGVFPSNLDEIAISKNMAQNLLLQDCLNKTLYLSFSYGGFYDGIGQYHRQFITTKVKVIGIVNSDKNMIYHLENWLLEFFMLRLGVSYSHLIPYSLSFGLKGGDIKQICSSLTENFPDYIFYDPLSDIYQSIEEVGFYLEISLFALSFIATIISIVLILFSIYVHILETKKDMETVYFIGVSQKESRKFMIFFMLLVSFFSFLLASIELVAISFISSFELANIFVSGFSLSLNLPSFFYMGVLATVIFLIPSLFLLKAKKKLKF